MSGDRWDCSSCMAERTSPTPSIATRFTVPTAPLWRSWLDDAPNRNFDVFALHYGSNQDNFTCPECVGVLHQAGTKWHLVHRLSQLSVWQGLLQRYKLFMLPDDDVIMSTNSAWLCGNLWVGEVRCAGLEVGVIFMCM